MNTRERILAAARKLAEEEPLDRVSLAEVARKAGVSWPTVQRHVGNKERLMALLTDERPGLADERPDTRDRLLASASRVFAQRGYDGATLDEVAADAGLTKGAIYWHFAGKSDLFLALVEENVERQTAHLPGAVRAAIEAKDPMASMASILADQLAACVENRDWPRLFLEFSASSSHDPELQKRLRELHEAVHEIISDNVRRAQEEGRLDPDLDPLAVSVLFNSLLNGLLLTWLADPGQVDPENLTPKLAEILWHGMKPKNR